MVIGSTTHPAPMPTAKGTLALSRMFLFRDTMLPVMAATSTYSDPGISFSPDDCGGANDATVLVKLVSRSRAESMKSLTLPSAAATCACRNVRVFPICAASRSVGVGEVAFVGSRPVNEGALVEGPAGVAL